MPYFEFRKAGVLGMKSIQMNGRTVEEAVQNALRELNVTEDKVNIKIIDEGSKGLFKLFKGKDAIIEVTLKNDYIEDARKFLREVLNAMGILAEIDIKENDDIININLIGPNMGLVIGHRGETLNSIQYLVSLVINKNNNGEYKKVILDTENYRSKREETLKRLATKIAYKVRKTNRAVKLEPMNPYERRIIHATLQNDAYGLTYSEGEEPYRKVVVDLKKKA